jgi:hypothetical protein
MPQPLPKLEQMTDILDIKPIIRMDLLWLWLILLVLLGLLLYAAYRKFRRKEKKAPAPVIVPRRKSPRETALEELTELDRLGLLERGQFRKYYFRLSEILRVFLQDELNLPAVDATTEEIRPHLRAHRSLGDPAKQTIEQMLLDMDLVKFAKFIPSRDEVRLLVQNLRQFIEGSSGDRSSSVAAGSKSSTGRG